MPATLNTSIAQEPSPFGGCWDVNNHTSEWGANPALSKNGGATPRVLASDLDVASVDLDFSISKPEVQAKTIEPSHSNESQHTSNLPSKQLFVGNLPPICTADTLHSVMSIFGKIEHVSYFPTKGYGFVAYENLRVACFVKEQMGKYPPILDGNPLNVGFGKSIVMSRQLFIGNLTAEVTPAILRSVFAPFGAIERVKCFPARGYGFITFCSLQVAVAVMEHMRTSPAVIFGQAVAVQYGKVPKRRASKGHNSITLSSGRSSPRLSASAKSFSPSSPCTLSPCLSPTIFTNNCDTNPLQSSG
jgi:RNA recognition motif-containing protein